jgi:hypothetical protein
VKQIALIQLVELKALFQEEHGSCQGRYVGSGYSPHQPRGRVCH